MVYQYRSWPAGLLVFFVGALCSASLHAQSKQSHDSLPTAGERVGMVRLWRHAGPPVSETSTSRGRSAFRLSFRDGLDEAKHRTQEWARSLKNTSLAGIQLDAAGEVFVEAGDLASAEQVFDKRLSTPGLSLADSVYTLGVAVYLGSNIYGNNGQEASLRFARRYLEPLLELPAAVNGEKFKGYLSLAYAFYRQGNGGEVANNIVKALSLVKEVSFPERQEMMGDSYKREIPFALNRLGEVWSMDTTKREALDSLGRHMLDLVKASQEELANDTRTKAYARSSMLWTDKVKGAISMNALLGKKAPPLVATHWYNVNPPVASVPEFAPKARALPLGDGSVHVVEIGATTCSSCLAALPTMERIRDRFAGDAVNVWYLPTSEQRWGAQDCTPDEAAEHVYKLYVSHHGFKLPIGVWAPPVDDSTRESGAVLARENPNFAGYFMVGTPLFVVIDRQGTVRRVIRGTGATLESTITDLVSYLLAENRRSPAVTTIDTPFALVHQ